MDRKILHFIVSMQEENDDLEWEEWNPSEITFGGHMIAGSIAGLVEHVTIFPIDTIKTHIQYERSATFQPLHSWENAKAFLQRDGFFRLWRGVSATFAGCIPAHSAYFTVFEASKKAFGADQDGHHPIQAAACGSLAAISHDMFLTPFDVVKQRMQLGYYKNVLHCIRTIMKTEGLGALYTSFPTTLMMNIPFGAVMMAVNESMKKILNPDGRFSTASSMISGSVAGAIAAAMTNPLDVIKTRLQTQNLEHCTKSCEDPHFNVPTGAASPAAGSTNNSEPRSGPTARKHVPRSPGSSSSSSSSGSGSGYPRAKYRQSPSPRPAYFSAQQPANMKFSSDALSIKGSSNGSCTPYRSQCLSRRLLGSVSFCSKRAAAGTGCGQQQQQHSQTQRMRALTTKVSAFSRSVGATVGSSSSGGGGMSGMSVRNSGTTSTSTPPPTPPTPPTPSPSSSPAVEAVTTRPSTVGMVQMAQRIYAEEGLRGFARGIVPRMLVHAPSVAISWTAYEAMKSLIMNSHQQR